jgi:hypothetical protein
VNEKVPEEVCKEAKFLVAYRKMGDRIGEGSGGRKLDLRHTDCDEFIQGGE